MSAWSTEERIRELTRGLEPVRPIPAIRSVLAAAVALGLVALAAHWLLGGPGLRPGGDAVSGPPYVATLAGLAAVALGALGAALAVAVPGRERAAHLGIRVAASGLALALAGGLWGVAAGAPVQAGAELDRCLWCMGRALALGVVPVLLACAFIVYGAVQRPGLGAVLALAGGVALGAAGVHTTCPSDSPSHWLLAHSFAPVAALLVLGAPVGALLTRVVRRR